MGALTGEQMFVLDFKMADGNGDAAVALDAAIIQMRNRSRRRSTVSSGS